VPTYDVTARFLREYAKLTPEQKARFGRTLKEFVDDLTTGTFRPSLRLKRVQGQGGVWEMSWAPDGRATFEYGGPVLEGQPHDIWRRIGGHEIFDQP
jgi:hypothetical protein